MNAVKRNYHWAIESRKITGLLDHGKEKLPTDMVFWDSGAHTHDSRIRGGDAEQSAPKHVYLAYHDKGKINQIISYICDVPVVEETKHKTNA